MLLKRALQLDRFSTENSSLLFLFVSDIFSPSVSIVSPENVDRWVETGTETVACFEPIASYLFLLTVPRQFFHTSGKFTRVILSAFLSLRSLSPGVYTRFLDSASRDFHPCRARSVCCLHERRVHTRRAPRSKIDPRTTPDMCVFLSPLQPGIPRVLACPTFASILRVHRLSFPVCPLRRSRRFSSAAVPVRTHVRRAGSVHACGTRA